MGDDPYEVKREGCPFGRGRISYVHVSPGHPYAQAGHGKSDQLSVSCPTCRKRYELRMTRTGNVWLYNKKTGKRRKFYDEITARNRTSRRRFAG